MILKIFNIKFFIATIFIIYLAYSISFIRSDLVYTIIFLTIVIIFFLKNGKIDKFIIYIVFFWIIINIISLFHNDIVEIDFLTFFGVTMKMLIPHFMVKIIGEDFFDYLINYIFYLCIFVTPLYLIGFFYTDLFNNMSNYLNFITENEQMQAGGWYIYFYMHNVWAYLSDAKLVYRNSGFMWEPGGFAMILIFSLTFRIVKNGLKWDKFILLFIFLVLTTFSTSGYLALFIIVLAFIYKAEKKSFMPYFVSSILFIIIAYNIYQSEFVSGKILHYIENIDYHYSHFSGVERVNRLSALEYSYEQGIVDPLGNGIFESQYMKKKYSMVYNGSNTIAHIIMKWGWFGLIFVLFFIYKFYGSFYIGPRMVPLMMTIAFCTVLFSNSLLNKPLIYAIIYYYFIENNYRKIINNI